MSTIWRLLIMLHFLPAIVKGGRAVGRHVNKSFDESNDEGK